MQLIIYHLMPSAQAPYSPGVDPFVRILSYVVLFYLGRTKYLIASKWVYKRY